LQELEDILRLSKREETSTGNILLACRTYAITVRPMRRPRIPVKMPTPILLAETAPSERDLRKWKPIVMLQPSDLCS
jgi:hypothetical protein